MAGHKLGWVSVNPCLHVCRICLRRRSLHTFSLRLARVSSMRSIPGRCFSVGRMSDWQSQYSTPMSDKMVSLRIWLETISMTILCHSKTRENSKLKELVNGDLPRNISLIRVTKLVLYNPKLSRRSVTQINRGQTKTVQSMHKITIYLFCILGLMQLRSEGFSVTDGREHGTRFIPSSALSTSF